MSSSLWSLLRTGEPNPAAPANARARPALFIARVVLVGLLVVVLCTGRSAGTGLLIALAVTGISAVVGFLFGIPRSAGGDGGTSSSASAPSSATASASSRPRNASLEQVADWLTKLMLGAGLTQLSEIKRGILALAKIIADCYCPFFSCDGASGALVFGLGVIGFFSAAGFLGGYLSTRLILARLLTEEDLDIDQLEKKAREAGRDQIERDVNQHKLETQKSSIATAAAADPKIQAALAAAESWQPPAAETVPNDPQKNRFGGQSEVNQRRLTGEVKALNQEDGELFQVTLKVASLAGAVVPLTSPVKFFLHYTFPQKTIVVPATAGAATLELVAWGAFTVGAIADDGKTSLELDLSALPTAPQKFRER